MKIFATGPRWLVVAAAAWIALPAWSADPTLTQIQQTGVINIGYRATAAPFSYATESGRPIGYAIEVCQLIAARVQNQLKLQTLQVNYVPVTAAERFDRILEGKIHLECADTTNSKARRERVAFGLAYYYAGARMMVRKDDKRELLSQMNGARIAVENGSTGQTISDRRKASGGSFTVVPVANTLEGAKAVAEGRADAFVSDDISLIEQAKGLKGAVQVVGPKLSVEPLAPIVPKNSPQFQELVQQTMTEMYRSGAARQLYRKWFETPLPVRGFSLDLTPDPLLSDTFRRPSPFVTDWTLL